MPPRTHEIAASSDDKCGAVIMGEIGTMDGRRREVPFRRIGARGMDTGMVHPPPVSAGDDLGCNVRFRAAGVGASMIGMGAERTSVRAALYGGSSP